jgi:ribosome-binding factor A
LTAIVLSPDSKLARVHYVVPRGRPRPAVDRAFARATGFLRGRLAEGVELKRTPDLRFIFEGEVDPTKVDPIDPIDPAVDSIPPGSDG